MAHFLEDVIAAHFQHSVRVRQAGMAILDAGDTALVLARTRVSATNLAEIGPPSSEGQTRDPFYSDDLGVAAPPGGARPVSPSSSTRATAR